MRSGNYGKRICCLFTLYRRISLPIRIQRVEDNAEYIVRYNYTIAKARTLAGAQECVRCADSIAQTDYSI